METGYIVSTVTESHLKSLRRSIEYLKQENALSVDTPTVLTLCNQFDRHYTTAGVLFLNQYELDAVWTPLYNTIRQTETIDTDAKRHIREIQTQLESFSPIQLESSLFDLPNEQSQD